MFDGIAVTITDWKYPLCHSGCHRERELRMLPQRAFENYSWHIPCRNVDKLY